MKKAEIKYICFDLEGISIHDKFILTIIVHQNVLEIHVDGCIIKCSNWIIQIINKGNCNTNVWFICYQEKVF